MKINLARDTLLQCNVALKLLPDALNDQPDFQLRLLREAKAAAAVDHPYIAKVYEAGEAPGFTYIALEYIEGATLESKLREGPLPLQEAIGMAIEIAEALAAAHGRGILHRDLKPSNIMLASSGHVKVMDFGLAKSMAASDEPANMNSLESGVTGSLALVGSVPYMSPAVIFDQILNHSAAPPGQRNGRIPAELEWIVEKAMMMTQRAS